MSDEFKIIIRNLRADTIIGVKPSERSKPQQVIINIEIWADLTEGALSDSIEKTVDYKVIKDEVLSYVTNSDFRLLEALAHGIAKICLQDHRVRMVKVTVDKPGALTGADSVGVEVVKRRSIKGAQVFIAIGSNINPEENVRRAVVKLRRVFGPLRVSTVYVTEPIPPNQPQYLNCVVSAETALSPIEVKNVLRGIENELGRVRTSDKYAPRTIDLDLILYGNLVIKNNELTIPDPEIPKRPFLLIPLYELEPDLAIPGLNKAVKELVKHVEPRGMRPLTEFTEELRRITAD